MCVNKMGTLMCNIYIDYSITFLFISTVKHEFSITYPILQGK